MKIPFVVGQPGPQGRYPVNLYFDPEQEDGRPALIGAPGLLEWKDLDSFNEVRGLHVMGSYLYAVCGSEVYKISPTKRKLTVGTIGTSTGPVSMAHNGNNQLMIVDGESGYIVTTGSLAEITSGGFPSHPQAVTFQDQYFIVSVKNSPNFHISALNDGMSWDATDYTNVEGWPDDLLTILNDHRELWAFGESSIEIYHNSGAADFPFDRMGVSLVVGCGAWASIAQADNSMFWLANDLMVRRAAGYDPAIVSTPQMNKQIAGYAKTSDAIGFSYFHEGHWFYCLTFPTEGKTWELDTSTKLWHVRKSYPYDAGAGTWDRWRGNCPALFAGKTIIGDYENGKLYELSSVTYTDNGEPMVRQRTAPALTAEGNNMFFHSLEIEFKAGVGLEDGSIPKAMLDWSNDDGRTWSNEHWRSIGKMGQYKNRARWLRLGAARSRIFRLTIVDPVEVVIKGAQLKMEVGAS